MTVSGYNSIYNGFIVGQGARGAILWSRGILMKLYHYVRWVEGIIVNTKKLADSLGNGAETIYEHLIFGPSDAISKTGGRVG